VWGATKVIRITLANPEDLAIHASDARVMVGVGRRLYQALESEGFDKLLVLKMARKVGRALLAHVPPSLTSLTSD
jgi:hypothetical protein